MPGAGKSTVGVVLAKKLGYHFLDSDILIQESEDRTQRCPLYEKYADITIDEELFDIPSTVKAIISQISAR